MRECCGETVRGCRAKAGGSGGISPDPARSLGKTGASTMLSFEAVPHGLEVFLTVLFGLQMCADGEEGWIWK